MGFKLLNVLPKGCQIKYTSFLYSQSTFLKTNNDLPHLHYYWFDTKSNSALAHVAFALEEGEAISPAKAPFGGIEFSNELPVQDLYTFIIFFEKDLQERKVKFLRFGQPPENHQNQVVLNKTLSDLSYKIKEERIFQGIPIEEGQLSPKMANMEQRRLRKCEKAGFEFKALGQHRLSKTYDVINGWRNAAHKPLSMSWQEIVDSRKANPNAYLPFAILDGDKLVAATIAIQVSESILYNFYPAHNPDYQKFSPMVMLINGLYAWSQSAGIDLIDLGSSYVDGKMSKSLFRFKSHVGGEESRALVFRKALSSR